MCGHPARKYSCVVRILLDRQRWSVYDIYATSMMESQCNSELQITTDSVSASCCSTMPLAKREKCRGSGGSIPGPSVVRNKANSWRPRAGRAVMSNKPNWRVWSCETKPILRSEARECGVPIVDCGLKRGQPCETKPNLGGMGYLGTEDMASGAVPQRGNSCQTKPIPGAGSRGPGIADCGLKGGEPRRTKPIGGPGRDTLPTPRFAKQSQSGGQGCFAFAASPPDRCPGSRAAPPQGGVFGRVNAGVTPRGIGGSIRPMPRYEILAIRWSRMGLRLS